MTVVNNSPEQGTACATVVTEKRHGAVLAVYQFLMILRSTSAEQSTVNE